MREMLAKTDCNTNAQRDVYTIVLTAIPLEFDSYISMNSREKKPIFCDIEITHEPRNQLTIVVKGKGNLKSIEQGLFELNKHFGVIFKNNRPFIMEVIEFEFENHHTIRGINDNWIAIGKYKLR